MIDFLLGYMFFVTLVLLPVVIFVTILISFLLYKKGLNKKISISLTLIPIVIPFLFFFVIFPYMRNLDCKKSFESVIGFDFPKSGRIISINNKSSFKDYSEVEFIFEFDSEDYQLLLKNIKENNKFVEEKSFSDDKIKYSFTTKKKRQDDDENIYFYNDLKTVSYHLFDFVGN